MNKCCAETLLCVAEVFDAKAGEARQDWVAVLLKSNTRARIDALTEAALLCRVAARNLHFKNRSTK